ncbi:MAG TPA: hypothetical protein VNG11_04465, partial [Chloroflexota bacterium]|nr:hypothetical protein [Chloroflexota bacterium]
PTFAYLMLGDSPDQYAIDRHHLSPLLPFVFFGSALGARRIGLIVRWLQQTITPARRKAELQERDPVPPTDSRPTVRSSPSRPATIIAALGRRYDASLYTPTHHTHLLQAMPAKIEWQPNQLSPDTHTITLPEARVRTPLYFQVGLYNLKTGARLPITNRGLPGGSDYVEFTSP